MTETVQGQTAQEIMRSPYADAVVHDWLEFIKHTDTCEPCREFARTTRRTNRYRPEDAEKCCEVGTTLILAWRGACDELKQHSAFARKVARK
jgi:hypothetical protein